MRHVRCVNRSAYGGASDACTANGGMESASSPSVTRATQGNVQLSAMASSDPLHPGPPMLTGVWPTCAPSDRTFAVKPNRSDSVC